MTSNQSREVLRSKILCDLKHDEIRKNLREAEKRGDISRQIELIRESILLKKTAQQKEKK